MKKARTFVEPKFKSTNKHSSTFNKNTSTTTSGISATLYNNDHWGGYVANTSNGGYQKISGDWVVPSVLGSNQTANSVFWVGLGGWTTNQLIQAGTGQDITVDSFGNKSTSYYFWWEALPEYPTIQQVTSPTVNPNDSVYVHISYDTTHASATFELQDLTTNVYTSWTQLNQSGNYDGSSAEWIVERPVFQSAPTLRSLANFGTANFSNAYAADAYSSMQLSAWGYNTVTMTNTTYTYPLATPYNLNGTTFNVDWKNYQ